MMHSKEHIYDESVQAVQQNTTTFLMFSMIHSKEHICEESHTFTLSIIPNGVSLLASPGGTASVGALGLAGVGVVHGARVAARWALCNIRTPLPDILYMPLI